MPTSPPIPVLPPSLLLTPSPHLPPRQGQKLKAPCSLTLSFEARRVPRALEAVAKGHPVEVRLFEPDKPGARVGILNLRFKVSCSLVCAE